MLSANYSKSCLGWILYIFFGTQNTVHILIPYVNDIVQRKKDYRIDLNICSISHTFFFKKKK